MVVYPAYAIQALAWEPLAAAHSTHAATTEALASNKNVSTASIRNLQQDLETLVAQQPLLLQEHQHAVMPPTHLDDCTTRRIFSLGDFVKRADDARDADVQQCAYTTTASGEQQRRNLSVAQLQELQQTGTLTVESCLLENQHHTWKVAPAFYAGRRTCTDSWKQGVGKSIDHVMYAGQAVTGGIDDTSGTSWWNGCSWNGAVKNGLLRATREMWSALRQLLVGRMEHAAYSERDVEGILAEAELGYCQHHLHLQEYDTRRLYENAAAGSTSSVRVAKLWDILQDDADWGTEYRLSSKVCREEEAAGHRLNMMQAAFDRKMGSMRSINLKMDQSRARTSPKAALEEHAKATTDWIRTRNKAWIEHLKNTADPSLKELAALEADRLLAVEIEQEVKAEDGAKVEKELVEYEASLRKKHRVLSLSSVWRNQRLNAQREKLDESFASTRLDRTARRLDTAELYAQSSLRNLSSQFRSEIRSGLAKSLASKRTPLPAAEFNVLQLDPNNWGLDAQGGGHQKYKLVTVNLGKPFWRVHYAWMMLVTTTKTLMGGSYHVLTVGPLSLRALVSPSAFYALERPVRDVSSLTSTLTSRLGSFYKALKQARERFEATPDSGLIGKSIQRFFFRLAATVKCAVGTVCIVAFMTIGTLFSTLLSTATLATAPFLAAIFTAGTMLFNVVVYDTAVAAAKDRYQNRNRTDDRLWFGGQVDSPSSLSPLVKIGFVVPYYLIVPGVFQAVVATVFLAAVHPLACAFHFLWANFRFTFRSLRDSMTWFFLRRYSRIPATDTFLATRIHGPGLARTEYYRLPVEAAKASVLLVLDKYRIEAHAHVRKAELEAPYSQYRNIFQSVCQPFGVGVSMSVRSPSTVGMQIAYRERGQNMSRYRSEKSPTRPPINENPLDIWDTVAQGIRSANPEVGPATESNIVLHWDSTRPTKIVDVDASICSNVDALYNEHKSKGSKKLDEMVNRAGKLWAEWSLKAAVRDQRLTYAVAIPPTAAGRFRMSQAEQQDLWKFTLDAVETYGTQLKTELEGILFVSEFPKELEPTVRHVNDSFYTRSGARPGTDVPVVAAFALRTLLGGEDVLDTLEETDETLVLIPKLSGEDEHLIFWKSLT